jgi:colanic acid/amylovoran biosynthesis glycosyltransferase
MPAEAADSQNVRCTLESGVAEHDSARLRKILPRGSRARRTTNTISSTRLKIAYLINQYPRVSHTFIRREVSALERQGFEVLRIALRGWDESLPDPDDQRERGLTRYVLSHGVLGLLIPTLQAAVRAPRRMLAALRLAVRMTWQSDRSLAYHLIYVAEACQVVRWTGEFGARQLHAHFGTNSAEIAMLAHVLGGPPYSFTAHGTDEFTRPMALGEKVSRSSFVVAISSFVRSQLYMHLRHSDWPKVQVVHCGVERTFYAVGSPPIASCRRLICIGRLFEAKGQLLLIQAAARLAANGVTFELVLAGDGPLRPLIESLIREHRLEGRVRITGWISSAQVREEILAARALVVPSFSEGLPVVIMEAMALRRPVLATCVAGIPELVRHGENGWLFAAGSVDALVAAMEDCLARQPAEIQALGHAGYERVIRQHSADTEAAKLAGLFLRTAADRPATAS